MSTVRYDQYAALATIEDVLGLPRLGNAANAQPITDFLPNWERVAREGELQVDQPGAIRIARPHRSRVRAARGDVLRGRAYCGHRRASWLMGRILRDET